LLGFPLAAGIFTELGLDKAMFWASAAALLVAFNGMLVQWGMLSMKIKGFLSKISFRDFISSAAEALAATMKEAGLISQKAHPLPTRRSDGSIRVRLEDASPEESALFAEALKELLGPYGRQRYLLVSYLPRIPRSPWRAMTWRAERDKAAWVTYPVPAILGTHRDKADQLAGAWSESLGPSEAVYVRGKKGKEKLPLLLPLTARRPSLRRLVHQLWR